MAKQLMGEAKFQIPGGQATPAPPVGTALGKFGINLGQFVQQFNDRTKEYNGTPIPVIVTVFADRSFEFVTKSPPAASLLKQAAVSSAHSALQVSGWVLPPSSNACSIGASSSRKKISTARCIAASCFSDLSMLSLKHGTPRSARAVCVKR